MDILPTRGISRDGAVVVVRPDQYVAGVSSLEDTEGLAVFFRGHLLPAAQGAAVFASAATPDGAAATSSAAAPGVPAAS